MSAVASLRLVDVWRDTAPTLCITLQLEDKPRVYVSASHAGQELRLADFIRHNLDDLVAAADTAIREWLEDPRLRDAA